MELRLLTERPYAETFDRIENELVDEYLEGALSEEERLQFEQHFLKAPQRRDKLSFTTNLRAAARAPAPVARVSPEKHAARWYSSAPAYLKAAALLIAILCVGLAAWLLLGRKSGEEPGIADLRAAYKKQRLVEARVTQLDYAPLPLTRGQEKPNVDEGLLRRAELQLLKDIDENPGAGSHHALGRFYLAGRQFDKAIEQFERALRLEPNNPQLQSDMGAALLERGKDERLEGDAGKSMETLARSLEHLNRALELDNSSLDALFNRAVLYQHMLLPAAAENDWKKYLERDSNSPWADEARRKLQALKEQGQQAGQKKEELSEAFSSAYHVGDVDAAWAAVSRGRSRSGNFVVEQIVKDYLAFAERGQDSEAGQQLRLLSFAGEVENQKAGDRYTLDLAAFYSNASSDQRAAAMKARDLMQLANSHYNRAEIGAALESYSEARSLFDRAGDSCEALFAQSWIGYCELRIPSVKQSIQTFQKLISTYQERQYKSLLAQALHAMSDAQTSKDEISEALSYASRSLFVSEQIQDETNKLRCLQQFTSMQLMLGDYVESLKAGRTGMELAATLSADPKLVWPFYHEAALDFYWLNLPAAALVYEREALRLAEESGWPLIISRSYARLGIIYEKLGDLESAISFGQRALDEGQRVSDSSVRLNILANSSLRLGHLYREAGDYVRSLSSYDDSLRMHEKLGLDIYLYETHKGKFLAYSSLGDDAHAGAELDESLTLFEKYRSKIQEERNRNSFFDVGQNIYDLAIDFAFTRLHDTQKAFEYAETSRARSLLDLLHSSPELIDDGSGPDLRQRAVVRPLGLSEIQQRLPAGVQLLQYALLDDRLIIWVVTREICEARTVPIVADEFKRKVVTYLRMITYMAVDEKEWTGLAKELYETLILPVEPLLSDEKQVYIVPDKVLFNLPYGALMSPETGRYFIEKYSFAETPSANVFVACSEAAQETERPGRETLLAIGDPSFEHVRFPGLQRLPAAVREAKEVAALYGVQPLLGREAQESRVRAAMLRAEVVHVASHYVIDEKFPMLSGLVLTGEQHRVAVQHDSDGELQAFEVYGMKFPRARLVVLSACDTGAERSYQGEGAVGLARAFISAGAPIVIASLWPVDSDATAELMIKFHRYRKLTGLASVQALRRAQLDMLGDSDAAKRQPYAWASFTAIGGLTGS